MPELSALQLQYRDALASLAVGGATYLPTLLLTGPPGAGKRTIARSAAIALGMEFVSARVDGVRKNVEELLFGKLAEAQSLGQKRSAPGFFGANPQALIYLSGIENLDPVLWNALASVATSRAFRDALGYSWRVSPDAWIVGGLKVSSSDYLVGPEHWLCAAFEQRMRILPPTNPNDLLTVCRSVLSELPVVRALDPSLTEFFLNGPTIPDNLHSIRRWVEIASSNLNNNGPLTRGDLEAAMVEDLRWVLARLSYRGVNLTLPQFSRWADQFRRDLRPLAAHLVRQIADSYFIGSTDFYRFLDELIARSGIAAGGQVAFCSWEPLGKSSPRVAHAMKNQARWKVVFDINLAGDPRTWPNLQERGVRNLILADDFVGSGKTLSRLFLGGRGPLAQLLLANPEVSVHVLIVAGFEGGLRNMKFSIPALLLKQVRMVVARLFTSRDQCFESKSRILTSDEQRKALQQFCLDVAAKYYPGLHPDARLGFNALGALVVFPDTVPNNSLPILWHDTGGWLPLFPASGLPAT